MDPEREYYLKMTKGIRFKTPSGEFVLECVHCGFLNPDGAEYCRNDGSRLFEAQAIPPRLQKTLASWIAGRLASFLRNARAKKEG